MTPSTPISSSSSTLTMRKRTMKVYELVLAIFSYSVFSYMILSCSSSSSSSCSSSSTRRQNGSIGTTGTSSSSSMSLPLLLPPASAFTPTILALPRGGEGGSADRFFATKSDEKGTATKENDLLSPAYEIEPLPIRIGHGFDIHRMAPIEEAGQPIVIGGVVIDHTPQKYIDVTGQYTNGKPGEIYETLLGVVAHSDGDVIYHSIVDAIFGALTLPDIGQVFADTDPRWKGCDSSKFMEYAYEIMHDKYGYQIGNIDVTLILERPKVANFKPAMKENIVQLLHTSPGRVNIKARTHERVDSVGELRSLSCHVVLTLEKIQS